MVKKTIIKKYGKYSKRKWRRYRKKQFLKAVSNYQYLKVQVPLYLQAYIPDPAGVMQLSGYRLGTAQDQINYASSSDHQKFPALLYNSNEFNQFKGQFSVYRIRSVAVYIEKYYDPRYNENKNNNLKNPITLVVNMNRSVSQNELNFGTNIEVTNNDNKKHRYFINKVKNWYRTDFSVVDSATWGDDNNGEIYVSNNDTLDMPSANSPLYPKYKLTLTFYVLFKENKYN